MKSLPIVTLSSSPLPPAPTSPNDTFLFFWHPEEEAFWLLVLVDDANQRGVWRVSEEGTGTRILTGDELALPDELKYGRLYLYPRLFYFDTARRQPVWLLSTHEEVLIGVFDGRSFSRVKQENTVRSGSDDSFVFDPARGVLVHFAGQEKLNREGLSIRELGVDGRWQDKGVVPGIGASTTFGCWEERRKLAVVHDQREGKTLGWNGSQSRELPGSPLTRPAIAAINPRSKGLVFIEKNENCGTRWYASAELTDDGWVAHDKLGLELLGPFTYVPGRNESYVYGPWFGPQTAQHTLGRYDGEKVVLAGRAILPIQGGSMSGAPLFWSTRTSVLNKSCFDGEVGERMVFAFADRALRACDPSPSVLGIRADRSGCVAVGSEGEVHRRSEGKWASICKGPEGFAYREASSFGTDGNMRILLVGGRPSFGKKHLADSWLFDGEKWQKLPTKGTTPKTVHARVAYDPARSTWIVIGGRTKDGHSDDFGTYELTGNKWVLFESTFKGRGERGSGVRLLARDEASGQLFLLTWQYAGQPDQLFVYRGQGQWLHAGSLDTKIPFEVRSWIDSPYAYDAERRVLVAAAGGSLIEIEIGGALDAVSAAEAAEAGVETKADTKAQAKPKTAPPSRRAKPTEEALPPSVWPRMQEGESDEHASEKEDAAITPGRMSYRMKLGKLARLGEDTFGGIPAGVTKESWPVCAGCKHPMPHVMTLHAHPDRLPLKEFAALVLFVCSGEFSGGACETFDPKAGCNAALLLTAKELERAPLSSPPSGKKGELPSKAMRARKITYREVFEADPEKNENVDDIEPASKVGGYPGWLQSEDTPRCGECAKEMRFVAEIGEIGENMNFAGDGEGYLFCCPDEHQAKFLWQH